MNTERENGQENYRAFLLLAEIEKAENLSQRDLSRRLGIALGLVNSYLKNLVAKGFVRVKSYPRNRYAYLLTPKGLTEKSRLAYQHLSYFTGLYTTTRQDYLGLFRRMQQKGAREIVFCGIDEVAEIAFMSLQETNLSLVSAMDDKRVGELFLGRVIQPLAAVFTYRGLPIVVTSLKKGPLLRDSLLALGVRPANILGAEGQANCFRQGGQGSGGLAK
ncbi:transcriptional regulator [Desulfuromonas sp. DDH964]|uniref:winged helix-turn-helix transcriptional regulator n=1 Tax=Desulfuromonas sp. DDH964 TaxID=1823759 RepID=UPI00078C49AC|nr:winged helix-turn-helix transcriptional regulator [Desulfuromonas sp. DDH964]AMV73151.1 transcriptional regulator [Desulfuromonas sp. DDH964]